MVNALKKPNQFINEEDEELSSTTVSKPASKSKRPLIAVILVLALIAAYSLTPDLKEKPGPETIASSENSLEKPVAPPTEEQKIEPLPAQIKSEQTSQAPASERVQNEPAANETSSVSLTQEDKKEFSFKNDKEYLAMNRFERFPPELKAPVVSRQSVRESTDVVDKPLVLAGKGFDIQGFQSHASQVIQADFLQHLNRSAPKVKPVRVERLDLQLTQAKSSKHLIFHPLGPALSQLQKPVHWEDPKPQNKQKTLKRIPETKLLFSEGGKSDLLLRPGSESLDLMIGNEKINRREYGGW
jgi:hypothetical protein